MMKVKIRETKIVSQGTSSQRQMLRIRVPQERFIFLCPQKVYCMYGSIVLHHLDKVPFKSRLRCVGPGHLNALSECLYSLLFPEYWREFSCLRMMYLIAEIHTRNASPDLNVAHAVLVSAEKRLCLPRSQLPALGAERHAYLNKIRTVTVIINATSVESCPSTLPAKSRN